MTRLNARAQLAFLWKTRHTHTDDTLQEQITVIRETVEQAADAPPPPLGAHVHVVRTSTQSIAAGGEAVEWTGYHTPIPRANFDAVTFPATEIVIPLAGYYDVAVVLGWSSFEGGGAVTIVRVSSNGEETVYPTLGDPGVWTSDDGQLGDWVGKGIPCQVGDTIKVVVDHQQVSPETLASADLSVELVDRAGSGTDFTFTYGEGSITAPTPTNTEVGDLIIVLVSSAEPTVSTPSGLTRAHSAGPNSGGSDPKYVVDWMVATAASTGFTYTVSGGTGETDVSALVFRLSPDVVDTSDPFDSTFDDDTPAADTASVSCSVTSATDNAILLFAGFTQEDDDPTHDYSTGMTRRVQAGIGGERLATSYATELLPSAGASGTKTMTPSATSQWSCGILVALTPA